MIELKRREKTDREYDAVFIENEYIKVMVLQEGEWHWEGNCGLRPHAGRFYVQ